jgi:APA family basic amino acid/polyamine antiporter
LREGRGEEAALKRELGVWGSFSMGYADVGADIFIALGVLALYASSAAPLALLIAAITYVSTGLCYAELASRYPVAGGGQYYALRAFGPLHGFLVGWGLMLDYTIDIALFSLATVGYLAFLLRRFFDVSLLYAAPYYGLAAVAHTLLLTLLNLVGIRHSSRYNEAVVLLNLSTLGLFALIGVPYAIASGAAARWLSELLQSLSAGTFGSDGWGSFVYGITLAMASYIGIESISQAAEETRDPSRVIPRASKWIIASVILGATLFSFLSVSLRPWQEVARRSQDPLAFVAEALPVVGPYLGIWMGFLGFLTSSISANAGVVGVSRVSFAMARSGLLPSRLSAVSSRFRTPYVTILLFSAVSSLLLLAYSYLGGVELIALVASLYNFGALFAYAYVNLSALVLRVKEPEGGSWSMPLNIRFRGKRVSLIPLFGFISSSITWLAVVGTHELGRLIGGLWFLLGTATFLAYRRLLARAESKAAGRHRASP